jgi:hypothetical protein
VLRDPANALKEAVHTFDDEPGVADAGLQDLVGQRLTSILLGLFDAIHIGRYSACRPPETVAVIAPVFAATVTRICVGRRPSAGAPLVGFVRAVGLHQFDH